MGGAQLPAVTNSGSGNQGITATVPVCVIAEYKGSDEEQLIRALALSHLTAIYVHSFLPILSAYCATHSAAMGAATGICLLIPYHSESTIIRKQLSVVVSQRQIYMQAKANYVRKFGLHDVGALLVYQRNKRT